MNLYRYVGTRREYPNTRAKTSTYALELNVGRSQCFSQSMVNKGPKTWNKLSSRLYVNKRNTLVSVNSFKYRLKREMFASYCNL